VTGGPRPPAAEPGSHPGERPADGTPAGPIAGPALEPAAGPTGVVRVVVDLPLERVFDYRVPAALAGRLAVGQRVRVPFRGRPRPAVVVGLGSAEGAGLAEVEAPLDPVPALTPALLALCRWAAEETVSAWGQAVARALPPPGPPPRAPAARAGEATPEPAGGAGAPAAGGSPAAARGLPVVATGAGRDAALEAAVARARADGRGVLVLAPEVETAAVWAARLGRRLGEPVALVTGSEPPRRRWEAWWAVRDGAARTAVGTRAAAFLPVPRLGLVAVLDEADPAHKAPDAPRWHARDLALGRAAAEGAGCRLLAGAPSLEAWAWVEAARALGEAGPPAGWPAVHRVDLRTAGGEIALAPGLVEALAAGVAARRPALLLLNRLGYGRTLSCAECGAARRCARCRVALVYHREGRLLACRLCGDRVPAASLCPRCRGRRLQPGGWGTERLEAEVRAALPGARVARLDGTLAPARAAAARAAYRRGEVDVAVGTHMLLRLLPDRPPGLAALVAADATLNVPDFRAGERLLQLGWRLAETLGPGGSLWIQAFDPGHPALEALAAADPAPFYRQELAERRELGYPPVRRMAYASAGGSGADALAAGLAGDFRAAGLEVLGPAALPGGRWRVVLLGDASLPRRLGEVLAPLRGRRRLGATRLRVDVDPVELD
jgi:primosomal protein N' (replication factor Y)